MLLRRSYRPPAFLPSLQNGLVAWWRFIDGNGLDSSGHPAHIGSGNDGILVNSAVGPALKFSSSRFTAGTPASIVNVTAACWVNPSVLTRGDLVTVWFKGSGGNNDQFNLLYGQISGKPDFFVSDGVTPVDSGTGSTAMTTGNWYHVAGTYDGATIRVYLNGVLQSSFSSSLSLGSGAGLTYNLGNNIFGDGQFTGYLADVRVYNRVLSLGELFALANEAYQPKFDIENIALMGGFIPKFRKTFSGIGGRIGTRQPIAQWGM